MLQLIRHGLSWLILCRIRVAPFDQFWIDSVAVFLAVHVVWDARASTVLRSWAHDGVCC